MVVECKKCNRTFISEDSLAQHMSVKHSEDKKGGTKVNLKSYIIFMLIGLIIIFSVVTIYSYSQKAGAYDEFATCLAKSGAIIYGNDFCEYTNKQLNYFGKSERYLNYIKCADNQELCDKKGVKITPTWEISNKTYQGVQTFKKLSDLTGCKI